MTLAEEDPEYGKAVQEYLKNFGVRRVPWGGIVVGGMVTHTRSAGERKARAELGETAIFLLDAMGVTASTLEEMTELPWDATGEQLIAKLQEIRSREQPAT
jgi:hypothetical protein